MIGWVIELGGERRGRLSADLSLVSKLGFLLGEFSDGSEVAYYASRRRKTRHFAFAEGGDRLLNLLWPPLRSPLLRETISRFSLLVKLRRNLAFSSRSLVRVKRHRGRLALGWVTGVNGQRSFWIPKLGSKPESSPMAQS